MVSNKFFVIVAGVGPGTGRSVALRFSEAYPVVLLARRPESYSDVVAQINKAGGKAIGITADATDASSLALAFESIGKEFQDLQLVAAIYNVRPNSRPSRKPFLELNLEDLDISLNGNVYVLSHNILPWSSWHVPNQTPYTSRGLFSFAQTVVPLLLKSVVNSPHPPTLIVTVRKIPIESTPRKCLPQGDISCGLFEKTFCTSSISTCLIQHMRLTLPLYHKQG
jgi:NAD(P)-dependent dehydrogenase (short-subunit alcohol dehydrogenase family)